MNSRPFPSRLQSFCFFLFFLSLCRFGALWSSKLLFFLSLCRFGALWSLKLVFFFWSLCRFRAIWSLKPNALLHVYCDIIIHYFHCSQIIVRILAFLASHAAFWRVRCIFHAKGLQIGRKMTFFKNTFCFQDIVLFSFWNVNIFQSHMHWGCIFYWYLQCF